MTTMKLTKALKERYGTGRAARAAVLKKLGMLGLDEDLLLSAPPPSSSNNNGGNGKDAVQALRTELEKMAGAWLGSNKISDEQIEELYALMDEHAPRDQGEENEERLRRFLAEKNFTAADIDRALGLANGKGNAIESGLRGQQIAGDAAIDRIVIEPNFGGDRRMSMAEATALVNGHRELVREFPDIARIRTG